MIQSVLYGPVCIAFLLVVPFLHIFPCLPPVVPTSPHFAASFLPFPPFFFASGARWLTRLRANANACKWCGCSTNWSCLTAVAKVRGRNRFHVRCTFEPVVRPFVFEQESIGFHLHIWS